jgi:hypothetical protein
MLDYDAAIGARMQFSVLFLSFQILSAHEE